MKQHTYSSSYGDPCCLSPPQMTIHPLQTTLSHSQHFINLEDTNPPP